MLVTRQFPLAFRLYSKPVLLSNLHQLPSADVECAAFWVAKTKGGGQGFWRGGCHTQTAWRCHTGTALEGWQREVHFFFFFF